MLKSGKKRRKGMSPIVNVRERRWMEQKDKLSGMFNRIEYLQMAKDFETAQILIDEAIRITDSIYREVQALGSVGAKNTWKKLHDTARGYNITNL